MSDRRNILMVAGLLGLVATASAAESPEGLALFDARIRPALVEHCYMCHSARAAEPKGGLRLDTREGLRRGGLDGPVIEPGKPDESLLIRIIEHTSEIAQMPPKGKLPEPLIADFRKWVELGAPVPEPVPEAPVP